jgi:hypothetical protein
MGHAGATIIEIPWAISASLRTGAAISVTLNDWAAASNKGRKVVLIFTGFGSVETSFASKWLELLTQIAPGVKRAAIMFNPDTAP